MIDEPLVCPTCARPHPASERFCEKCGMPLIEGPGDRRAPTATQRRARKIRPEYAQGRPVTVHRSRNPAQAEFLAGMLLEEGIPSYLRSVVNGRGQLGGERDILVPESGAEAAREALSPPRRTAL